MLPLRSTPTGDISRSIYVNLRTEHTEATEPQPLNYHIRRLPHGFPMLNEECFHQWRSDLGLKQIAVNDYPRFGRPSMKPYSTLAKMRDDFLKAVNAEVRSLMERMEGEMSVVWRRRNDCWGGCAETLVQAEHSPAKWICSASSVSSDMIRRAATQIKLTRSDVESSFPRKVYFTLRTQSDQPEKPDHPIHGTQIFPSGQDPPLYFPSKDIRWSYTSPAQWDLKRDFVMSVRTKAAGYPDYIAAHAAATSHEVRPLPDNLRESVNKDLKTLDKEFEEVLVEWAPDGAEDGTRDDELAQTDRMKMEARIQCIKGSMKTYICRTTRRAITVAVKVALRAATGEGGQTLRDRCGLAILLFRNVVALELSAARLGGKSVVGALAGAHSSAEDGEDGDNVEAHFEGEED
ncbi:hypothetical protein BKA63DRAFT_496377 [Paraphoma chrysanthemicola]|nr:hypothetical protein BKA63DRAFT_496377 [Paraphoma chrysanthemicola]